MGVYACYIDEYGEYQWTDKPDPNWKLIPEITKPDKIPIKTKVASSTPTPSSEPTPVPQPEPTPQPTPTRFSEKINADGSKTIYDYENRYTINYTKEDGYIAFNDKGEEVYHIYPDGNVDIKTYGLEGKDGFVIWHDNTSIDEMGSNMTLVDSVDKIEYSFRNGKLVKRVYKDGSSDDITYNNNGTYSVKRLDVDGNKEVYQYDEHNILYREDYSFILENGNYDAYSRVYLYDVDANINKQFFLEGNEVVDYYDDDNDDSHRVVIGKIDNDGNYVINGENGEVSTYNAFGQRIKRIDSSGNVYDYDYAKNSQIVTRNDQRSYSKINHIEYDEEAYNNIIKSFNSVGSSYQGVITSACSSIESAVNSFPDSYSSAGISSVGSSVEGHIGLISSLGEMTNYSILAYQTCDDSLEKGLYLLIDSLFGDSDTSLSEKFKKAISNTTEDRDGIISYNEDTNFKTTTCIVDLLINSPSIIFLEGEELADFRKNYNLAPLDTLLISKETENINGVDFDIYKVIDTSEFIYGVKEYNKYISESNKVLSNIDEGVLEYMRNKGAHLVYFSSHTVDNASYDENGKYSGNTYSGYAHSVTRGAVSVYGYEPETILHEMGHTLDHCLYYDQTGEYGTTTTDGYDYGLMPNKTNTRKLAHREYGAYNPNYQYVEDYSNDDSYIPCEFFAESFRNYYTTDAEKRERFARTIPETFKFFDDIEKWVGEQNANQ